MSTLNKGRATEAAVLNAFASRDYAVLVPFGDGLPYDLAVDLGTAVLRVQCKTARPTANGCIDFNCFSTDHGRGRLSYLGLADVFGVYYALTQATYIVPVRETAAFSGRLRLQPARNNQQRRIRMAADYEFDRWLPATLCELAIEGRSSLASAA